MFHRKSDYALNKKNPDAIVCKSVTDIHIRLTRADFSSEEEFLKWKVWSDEDYHATEKAGRTYHDLGLPLEDWAVPSAPSVEELLLEAASQASRDAARTVLAKQIRCGLTEKQLRRLCLYYLEGKKENEIAELEGVGQQRISRSLHTGKTLLEKIFKIFIESRG